MMGEAVEQADESGHSKSLLRREEQRADFLMQVVIPAGVALAQETEFDRLLERMLIDAMHLCNADGGTLYLRTEADQLQFAIMRTDSLGIALGGTTGKVIPQPPIPLFESSSLRPNHSRVAAHAALTGKSVNVADVYAAGEFDFSGPKAFDAATGYRTCSLLAIPLHSNGHRVTGVIQLINARAPSSNDVIPFDPRMQQVIESLCLLAGAALVSFVRQLDLKAQVRQLKIEIDQSKRDRQVEQIADSDYFKGLKSRARELQERARGKV
jgi:hypothetical protein